MLGRTRPRVFASCAALAACLCAGEAHAQYSTRDRRDGLEAQFDLGYGALTGRGAFCRTDVTHCGDGHLGGSVGTQVHVGYQFVPLVSAGLHFTYNAFTSDLADTNVDSGGNSIAFGVYVRVHLLELVQTGARSVLSDLDAYVGLGFDFAAQVSLWINYHIGSAIQYNQSNVWGYQIPITLGVGYRVHDNVSVGAMFQMSPFVFGHKHDDVLGFSSDDTAPRGGDLYVFVGLDAKLHFNLL